MINEKVKNTPYPLVSIIMGTYNGAVFLSEQLDTLLAQDYPNVEILISDDASTDKTAKILAEYAVSHPSLVIHYNKENVGYNKNFERLFHLAKGEFIAVADQDDIWHPQKISLMLKGWRPDVKLMYCATMRFKKCPVDWKAKPPKSYRRFEGTDARKISIFNTVSGHAMVIKKTLLPHILPLPENVYYDWWSAVVAACNGGVAFFPHVLVYQRVHELNASIRAGADHHDKEHKNIFNVMVMHHLNEFCKTPNMNDHQRSFFTQLSKHWKSSLCKEFSFPLFLFLATNSGLIFNFKRKPFALFSRVKHAFRLASNRIPLTML